MTGARLSVLLVRVVAYSFHTGSAILRPGEPAEIIPDRDISDSGPITYKNHHGRIAEVANDRR
jgi:hypothetical protein